MVDGKEFDSFKDQMIEQSEITYGDDVRSTYGDDVVDVAKEQFGAISKEDWDRFQTLTRTLNEKIKRATRENKPTSDLAHEVCELHRQWLTFFWPKGLYTKEAHKRLGQQYLIDQRFKDHYDAIEPGAAVYLSKAIMFYTEK